MCHWGHEVGNTCAGGEKESRTECRKRKLGEVCVCTRTRQAWCAPSREGAKVARVIGNYRETKYVVENSPSKPRAVQQLK